MRAVTETESRLFWPGLTLALAGLGVEVGAGHFDNLAAGFFSLAAMAARASAESMSELLRCATVDKWSADSCLDPGRTGGLPSREDDSARAWILLEIPDETLVALRTSGMGSLRSESGVLAEVAEGVLLIAGASISAGGSRSSGAILLRRGTDGMSRTDGIVGEPAEWLERVDLADRALGLRGGKKGLAGDLDMAMGVASSTVALSSSSIKASSARKFWSGSRESTWMSM